MFETPALRDTKYADSKSAFAICVLSCKHPVGTAKHFALIHLTLFHIRNNCNGERVSFKFATSCVYDVSKEPGLHCKHDVRLFKNYPKIPSMTKTVALTSQFQGKHGFVKFCEVPAHSEAHLSRGKKTGIQDTVLFWFFYCLQWSEKFNFTIFSKRFSFCMPELNFGFLRKNLNF